MSIRAGKEYSRCLKFQNNKEGLQTSRRFVSSSIIYLYCWWVCRYSYIVNIDTDEVIVPQSHDTWGHMMEAVRETDAKVEGNQGRGLLLKLK